MAAFASTLPGAPSVSAGVANAQHRCSGGMPCAPRPHSARLAPGPTSRPAYLGGKQASFLTGHALKPQTKRLHCSPASRSSSVEVTSFFSRFGRVVRSYTFFYGDSAVKSLEDPRKLLDQAVADMQADLTKMRQASAQVIATQRLMEDRSRAAERGASEWRARAELALRRGDEDLARQALSRSKSYQAQVDAMARQLEQHTKAYTSLIGSIRAMEGKVVEALSKKETLKARAASAQAAKMLNEEIGALVGGLRSSSNSSLQAFAQMEERVMALEAEAEASGRLGGGGDALEARFALLEGSTLDDDLLKLKTDMLAKQPGEKDGYLSRREYEPVPGYSRSNNVDIVWP